MGYASPEIWATGTARPCDAPEFEGFWEYCYEVHWTGLRNAVSHIEVILCPSGDCGCDCDPEFFAFADTVGRGNAQEDQILVHYYGGMESSGDPSTGLEGFLIKFEPFEGLSEPGQDGSATLCFYSVAAPVLGNYPDRIGMKFGGEYALGVLDGALPGCRQGFSPTDTKTWGYVKALYR
jgi:hypothetical protein